MRKHHYKAIWTDHGIKVTDPDGNEIKVQYAATSDNRTVHAFVQGVGFIGGWQYPHRRSPFRNLVDSINQGTLYDHSADLPNGRSNQRRHIYG